MASQNLLVLLLLCVMAVAVSAGDVYSAGGGSGWTLGTYIAPVTINSGDTVKFVYSSGLHSVYQVSGGDYDSCNTGSPLARYYSGADYVTLYNPGTYYFVCGVAGHCNDGMKLTVYVQ